MTRSTFFFYSECAIFSNSHNDVFIDQFQSRNQICLLFPPLPYAKNSLHFFPLLDWTILLIMFFFSSNFAIITRVFRMKQRNIHHFFESPKRIRYFTTNILYISLDVPGHFPLSSHSAPLLSFGIRFGTIYTKSITGGKWEPFRNSKNFEFDQSLR